MGVSEYFTMLEVEWKRTHTHAALGQPIRFEIKASILTYVWRLKKDVSCLFYFPLI